MSATISTDIVCDRCDDWMHGCTGDAPNRKLARERARRIGWRCDYHGGDICERCCYADLPEGTE